MNYSDQFNQPSYRQALRQFTTGVAVVTSAANHQSRIGVTINSLSSVSLEPPLLLWCLHNKARSLPRFRQDNYFCINILSAEQAWISTLFATPSSGDRFLGVEYTDSRWGPPVLDGTSAHFICRKYRSFPGGDHCIFLAEVIEFASDSRPPLLFYGGRYASMTGRIGRIGETPDGAPGYADFEFA